MDTLTPSLLTQSGTETYASAALDSSERQDTDEELCVWAEKMRREEEEYMEELGATRGHKRVIPSPSKIEDKQEAPLKKSMASGTSPDNEENNESSEHEENNDSSETAAPTQQELATPSSAGLCHFIGALISTGWQRSALMQAIPGKCYYYCQEIFLQHKQGDISNAKARSHVKNDKEKTFWKGLNGTISQDAFAMLLTNFNELQQNYGILASN